MNPKDLPDNTEAKLAAFRQQIDELDHGLITLLIERMGIVSRVGDLKNRTAAGICPIRSGREAEMIRRIMKKCEGTPLPPAAMAAIWRIIIGTSTALEAELKLSVFSAERDDSLCSLAREYFGPAVPITRQPHVKRVIGDVMDGKSAVGVVPMLRGSDTTYWWTNLMQQGKSIPRIFARIPFVYAMQPSMDTPTGLAIACVEPEPSGDDMSIIVIEAEHNVSQHRLQTAFAQAKLEATWINVATISPASRHHLVEIKGFVRAGDADMKLFFSVLGPSVKNTSFLGSYAVPITAAGAKRSTENQAVPHVAGNKK